MKPAGTLTKVGLLIHLVIPESKLWVYLALATEGWIFLVVKMFKATFKKA